jgi:hypothetical protein
VLGLARHNSVDEYTMNNNEIKMRLKNELIEAFYKIDSSMKSIYRDQIIFAVLGIISFIFIFLLNDYYIPVFIKTMFLLGFCIFCLWFIIFEKFMEINHLKSLKDSMKFILKSRYGHSLKVQKNNSNDEKKKSVD